MGESDGVPYLAMEYLEGKTLDAYTTPETRLPLPEVVALVAQAADALHFAHGRAGIVHRDIKPGNLLRVAPGRVKILDFGLAKTPLASMTQDGTVLGTPSYMAPEQIRGGAVDGGSDLFSLAVVLFEMVTGQKPFPGDSVSTVLYRIVHEEPQLPPPTPAGVPQGLHDFLQRALAKDPADRFPDASAFARALRGSLLTQATRPRTKRDQLPPPPPAPRLRARGSSLLPWVVAAAVVLGGAGYAVVHFGSRPAPAVVPLPQAAVRVRTDPPGLPVLLDGKPLSESNVPPKGTLTVSQGCRTVKRELTAGDAGGEVVLVPDPLRGTFSVAPEVAEAQVSLNGAAASPAPATLDLDLCTANVVEVTAPGYRAARTEVPAGATPLAARTALAGIALEKIPEGTLRLASSRFKIDWHVDGAPAAAGDVALPEGTHEVRAVNAAIWLDRTLEVDVRAGETVTPELEARLADLVVQAFPANCRVALRRGESDPWKEVDETPLRTSVFPGAFQVRVTYLPTGQAQEREVKLRPGANPPVRFSFRPGA